LVNAGGNLDGKMKFADDFSSNMKVMGMAVNGYAKKYVLKGR